MAGKYEATGRADVVIDALIRAWRTFYVSVGVDIAALIGTGLMDLLTTADVSSKVFWIAAGVLIVKSILTGVATFLLRLKVTPKNVETPVDYSI